MKDRTVRVIKMSEAKIGARGLVTRLLDNNLETMVTENGVLETYKQERKMRNDWNILGL